MRRSGGISILMAMACALPAVAASLEEPGQSLPDKDLLARGAAYLLEVQEGSGNAEWPYEGVYRVNQGGKSVIPIGYRVGGTALVSTALLRMDSKEDPIGCVEALQRATRFICDSTSHPLMQFEGYRGGYDVRGWGYVYGLAYLCELQNLDRVPDQLEDSVDQAIEFYTRGLEVISIPEWGGWNYSRRRNIKRPTPQAPFMTGPAIQALMMSAAGGRDVDPDIIMLALGALERSRSITGAVEYSGGDTRATPGTHVPGSAGRMLVTESTLLMAGRGSVARVRGALDAFFAHWDALEARRAKTGTHEGPWGVAPYYFFYAHLYAAQAIELLPEGVRDEYRDQLRERILSVRSPEGTWNDRVFPRSAGYSTALAMMSLTMPRSAPLIEWSVPETSDAEGQSETSGSLKP
ncbi:MAG: hypothetical protein VX908_00880 [Planctomycetota bacterium]|nr:hypothetical protein [Planctomycetota bacterium]